MPEPMPEPMPLQAHLATDIGLLPPARVLGVGSAAPEELDRAPGGRRLR